MTKSAGFFSGISFRLMFFNILLVFLPIAGLFYFDIFEEQLLISQENSMAQQGRILAAALSVMDNFNEENAVLVLNQLGSNVISRIRIIDTGGNLLADSSTVKPIRDEQVSEPDTRYPEDRETEIRSSKDNWLYNLASIPFKIARFFFGAPDEDIPADEEYYSSTVPILGSEIQTALKGSYGSATRLTPDKGSVILYSAVPVISNGDVIGVVLVSQSTYRILNNLYTVRIDIFKIFLLTVFVAVILSFILSRTIARPLKKLKNQAEAVLFHKGRLKNSFDPIKRNDEIGELSFSLNTLTNRLNSHLEFIELFSKDILHEFKNPLSSIKTALEVINDINKDEEENKFIKMIFKDISRMEFLLSGIREISKIDVELEDEPRSNILLNELLKTVTEGFKFRFPDINFNINVSDEELKVYANKERLIQVLENIIDNAVSFSAKDGIINISLKKETNAAAVSVTDSGPGIPGEHLEKIFDRFFSYRPQEKNKKEHTGMGLAIARTIVNAYKGHINAFNLPEGGAGIKVTLPVR